MIAWCERSVDLLKPQPWSVNVSRSWNWSWSFWFLRKPIWLQRLLTLYTSCALHHRWVDLGMRYWPRWFRTSRCLERHSCSIPAGFKCLPSNFTRKIILHYFCPKDEFQTLHCEWLRQQMLVVTNRLLVFVSFCSKILISSSLNVLLWFDPEML